MNQDATRPRTLRTAAGEYPLHEFHFVANDREWTLLHAGVVLTAADEQRFLPEHRDEIPYGVALWPAAIALAHDLAGRAEELTGKTILELGAGTGLPGIVAASLGAQVIQTDRLEAALTLSRINCLENGIDGVKHRQADWADLQTEERYDWIIGSDILYNEPMHRDLKRIFTTHLAPGGRVLLSDPMRFMSLWLVEELEAEGWSVRFTTWRLGEEPDPRVVGVYELAPG